MRTAIFLQGRVVFKPEIRKTKKDRDWARIHLEVDSTRELRKGEFVSETTIMPVNKRSSEMSADSTIDKVSSRALNALATPPTAGSGVHQWLFATVALRFAQRK
jgi:hypothetical protein